MANVIQIGPDERKRRQYEAMAAKLAEQASNTAPVAHWTQALARAMKGWNARKYRELEAEQEQKVQQAQLLVKLLVRLLVRLSVRIPLQQLSYLQVCVQKIFLLVKTHPIYVQPFLLILL